MKLKKPPNHEMTYSKLFLNTGFVNHPFNFIPEDWMIGIMDASVIPSTALPDL